MIVLDEQICRARIFQDISRWYKGAVICIKDLRPHTRILDDAMPELLRRLKQPTFVTIKYDDFWKIMPAHSGYCIVCLKLTEDRSYETPALLRALLKRAEFSTKRQRMGKVISVRDWRVTYYD